MCIVIHCIDSVLILHIQIFELPNLEQPVYVAPDMSFLPPVLSSDRASRRAAGKDTLTEILFADLGDKTSKSPYLIVGLILIDS